MKFSDRGVMSADTELAGEMIDKYLIIYDVVNQFSMDIDRPHIGIPLRQKIHRQAFAQHKMNMRLEGRRKTGSNFQIKLFKNFSN